MNTLIELFEYTSILNTFDTYTMGYPSYNLFVLHHYTIASLNYLTYLKSLTNYLQS